MTTDPVCGMSVDENKATASVYRGKTYHFCGAGCKTAFEKEPGKYAKA